MEIELPNWMKASKKYKFKKKKSQREQNNDYLFNLSKHILNDFDKYYKKPKKARKEKILYKYTTKNKAKDKQFKVKDIYYRNIGDTSKKYESEYSKGKHFWVKYIIKKLVKYSIYNKSISKESLLKYFYNKYSRDLTSTQIENRLNSTLIYLLKLKSLSDLRDLNINLPQDYYTAKVMKDNEGGYYLYLMKGAAPNTKKFIEDFKKRLESFY